MKFFILSICFIFLLAATAAAQGSFDFYLSNAGNDANAGTFAAPKKTIAGLNAAIALAGPVAAPLKLGFRSGDIFDESYRPGYPISAGTYFPNSALNKFAVLNGAKPYDNGWVRTDSTNNIYQQDIPIYGFNSTGINNWRYDYIYVFEIDRQLELTAPITAKRMLQFVPRLTKADSISGSFYEAENYAPGLIRLYIHTSNGRPPNHNPQYRYEVSVRDRAIYSTAQQNNNFERLWVTGFGAGSGTISAGAGSTFNRMIFGPGAAIHHVGSRGGIINNSLFLPGPQNTNGYAVVFYDATGNGRHNIIRNSIFLDIKYVVYSHVGSEPKYGALELNNVISFANPAEPLGFFQCSDTDSSILDNIYSDGHSYGYASSVPYASIRNAVLKDCQFGVDLSRGNLTAFIYNTYIRFNGGGFSSGISITSPATVAISKSIFHFKNTRLFNNIAAPVATMVLNNYMPRGSIAAVSNVFISEANPANFTIGGSYDIAGSPDNWNNNVYVLVSGSKMCWKIINSNTNTAYLVDNFNQWQSLSGQDANSLFFDLRNDPRGLKAVFNNPETGDYSLANTIEGNQVKQLQAGMVSPITCFLTRPTYEEAANIIMTDGVLTANACRKVCLQNNIRLSNNISSSITEKNKVQVQWDIEDESAIDHFEIMRSFGNTDFTAIASVPASGNADYLFTDSNVIAGITYRYSIAVVTKLVEKCYSAATSIKTDDGQSLNIYPNPSSGKIMLGLNAYTGLVKISIYNTLGCIVYTKEINAAYGIPPQIDLTSQSKGFYWIKVQTDKDNIMKGFLLR